MIRNDINGLKGIAILCVILYHISDLLKSTNPSLTTLFDGGFLGVDIFFVISGYLTCRGILTKCDDNSFSVITFYTKRVLRIIPPLIAVCLFTLILGYFLLFPNVYEELAKEAVSAFLFIANYRFADSGGYFSLSSQDKLLLHTWYLAVTFQFYLVFPLVLIALRKLLGNERLRFSILILFIISLASAVICSRKGQGYLLTECRIWEILLGCALFSYEYRLHNFFCKKMMLQHIIRIFATLGLLVSVFYVNLDNGLYYVECSVSTVVATALLLLIGTSGKSLYTFKPLCYLGIISYSLYLWHWPLMIFALRCGIFSNVSHIICILVLLTALSYLSYRYIEKTVFSGTAVALSLVLCIGSSFFIIKSNGDNYLGKYMVKDVQVMVNDDLPLEEKYSPRVVISDNSNHVYQYGDQTKTPSIFIIGDSHSEHYNYYLKNINKLPVYSLYMHATLAYGSRFNNYKVQMLSGPDERHTFYSLYTQMLLRRQNSL
ncbi:MAG: acyltransferase family protein [Succinivibrio sp.]